MKKGMERALAAALGLALLLGGCGGQTGTKAPDKGQSGLKIVTSFYPIYIDAINITKNVPGIDVSIMAGTPGGCLDDYNFKTGDMKKVEGADIMVINGAGVEYFMDRVSEQQPKLRIVDASRGITLLKDEETGEANPHVWVSVTGSMEQVRNIAQQLGEYDPDNAKTYADNAEAYVKKLEELNSHMREELGDLKDRNIVTFHEAFAYFAREFNLHISAVMEVNPGSEPQAGQLAAITDTVKRDGVKALFAEPQYSMNVADIIARETGAGVYVLDPVVTGSADGDADAYIRIMSKNADTLKEALSK